MRKRAELDVEAVELLRESPDLTAIADAIAVTQRPPRRSRTLVRLLAVAAALAVAGGVVSVVAPWQGHGGGLVERALAAVGNGPVLHAVIESDVPGESVVDLRTGARQPVEQRIEYWYDADRALLRAAIFKQGSLLVDMVQRRGGGETSSGPIVGATGQAPVLDPALSGFVSGYREALRLGAAREVGRGTLDGQAVIWLRFDADGFRERVALDAASYRPLVIEREAAGSGALAWHVREIETIARDQADFTTPSSGAPLPSSGQAQAIRPVSSAEATSVLGWRPLWLGESFSGLALQSAQLMRLTRGYPSATGIPTEESQGLSLSYGDATGHLLIGEALRPEPANGFLSGRTFGGSPLPQPGSADLVVFGNGGARSCTAQLQEDGVWVTITATAPDQCVAAAQALEPIGAG